MVACCCTLRFNLGWESPAAPCKSQHCWQPKSAAAHSPGKDLWEWCWAPLTLNYSILVNLFLHLFSAHLYHKSENPELRNISLCSSILPLPSREDTLKWTICLKGLFLISWPSLLFLPFALDESCGVRCSQQPFLPRFSSVPNRCFQNQCHRKHLLLSIGLTEKCCRSCRCGESSQQWKWFETFALSLFNLPLSPLLPNCWK